MAGFVNFNPAALVGKSLQQGRYALTQFLGQGSFAYVYKAEERVGGERLRDVAVKWIPEGDPAQLRREAQALAALPSHPNVVTLLTCLTPAPPVRGLILVLEFVDGQPLGQMITPDETMETRAAAGWLDQILLGLAHAHAHDVIHRDLKPDNILVRRDGVLKLTDFGIARLAEAGASTTSSTVRGTPAYMAPEQFGKRHDHRVDLYSAGVIAFEMLTGGRPFVGSPAEVLKSHLMDVPPVPAWLSPPLREFLDRSLEKEPDARFRDAQTMREALASALQASEASESGAPASLSSRDLWNERPGEALSIARATISGGTSKRARDEVQASALEMAEKLLADGRTESFRGLRRQFSALLELDREGKWRQRWAEMVSVARTRQLADLDDSLEKETSAEGLGEVLARLRELEVVAPEGPALWKVLFARVEDHVAHGRFHRSDPLIEAMGRFEWSAPSAKARLEELRSEALDATFAELLERIDADHDLDELFSQTAHLVSRCPAHSRLPEALRRFRKRLHREFSRGGFLLACQVGRRLQDELERRRPDLAAALHDLLEGSEGELIETVTELLRREGGFLEGVQLILMPEAQLGGDPRARGLADVFAAAFAARLTGTAREQALEGRLTDDAEHELTQGLGAWLRFESWCPREQLRDDFVAPLWAILESLLRGSYHERAQPLLELARELETVRKHPIAGEKVQFVLEDSVRLAEEEVRAALMEQKEFGPAVAGFERLVKAVPRHGAIGRLLRIAGQHLGALASSGRIEEMHAHAAAIRGTVERGGLPVPDWLEDPIARFAPLIRQYLEEHGSGADQLDRAVELLGWLRGHGSPLAAEMREALDRGLESRERSRELVEALGTISTRRVAAALEPDSAVALLYQDARALLDWKVRLLGGLAMLPTAFLLLPRLVASAGVPPAGGWSLTPRCVWAGGFMLAGSWMMLQWLPAAVRSLMRVRPDLRSRWEAAAVACGVLAGVVVFTAGAIGGGLAGRSP